LSPPKENQLAKFELVANYDHLRKFEEKKSDFFANETLYQLS